MQKSKSKMQNDKLKLKIPRIGKYKPQKDAEILEDSTFVTRSYSKSFSFLHFAM